MITISQLFAYPIKSLAGISVSSAIVIEKGFQHDRRWMLIDEKNNFLALKKFPKMALLPPQIKETGL